MEHVENIPCPNCAFVNLRAQHIHLLHGGVFIETCWRSRQQGRAAQAERNCVKFTYVSKWWFNRDFPWFKGDFPWLVIRRLLPKMVMNPMGSNPLKHHQLNKSQFTVDEVCQSTVHLLATATNPERLTSYLLGF